MRKTPICNDVHTVKGLVRPGLRLPPLPRSLRSWLAQGLLALGLLFTAGCDSDSADPPKQAGFAEVWSQGVTSYAGLAKVATETTQPDGSVTYQFDPATGPMCLRGAPFQMSVRTTQSSKLLIFLQGGGACWSDFCLAVTKAPAGVPKLDVLDPAKADNPWKDWNVAYLPYCDGSMFAGNKDHDDSGDGQPDRFHRGLRNVQAALDVAKQRFPEPSEIALVGSSGGAFGTIPSLFLVRKLWPDAPILIVQDSGSGAAKDGEPAFLAKLIDEFGVASFFPPSCKACKNASHLTPLLAWALQRDPNVRVAAFSSYQDNIMADVFLGLTGAQFKQGLLAATGPLHTQFPTRYKRFFIDGVMHTTLLGDASGIIGSDLGAVELPSDALPKLAGVELGKIAETQQAGVTIAAWLAAARDNTAEWLDLLQ